MLRRVLSAVLKSQAADLRRRGIGGLVAVMGAFTVCAGLAIAVMSAFLWLSLTLPAWQAALVVAGAVLLLGLALIAIGRRVARRPETVIDGLETEIRGLLHQASAETGRKTGLDSVVTAAVIGILIGRQIGK